MTSKRRTENHREPEMNRDSEKDYSLVLHNDDVHDFDFVIDSLINICDHDSVQAEQCTYIVHYCGKCDIKRGKYPQLKKMHDQLINKGLIVSFN